MYYSFQTFQGAFTIWPHCYLHFVIAENWLDGLNGVFKILLDIDRHNISLHHSLG